MIDLDVDLADSRRRNRLVDRTLLTDSRDERRRDVFLDEIGLIALDESLLSAELLDPLGDVADRGVRIYVGTSSDSVRELVEEAAFVATVFQTELIEWFTAMSDSPRIGRILVVDRAPILVSALHEEELPGVLNETAVWTDGSHRSRSGSSPTS